MAESKLAMSRALGAAFLNHQVEQLEKSVSNGAASGNWRDRKYTSSAGYNNYTAVATNRRPPNTASKPVNGTRKKGGDSQVTLKERDAVRTSDVGSRRKSEEEVEKDADIVIVDASVLVHSLNQVKKWCRNGRKEIVIVPLEALNTLDLLKKGSSSLAQRARAASRILEAQVGTNPRIRVQRDDAFVLWDNIKLSDEKAGQASPEWVRRTICCARWEADNANKTVPNATKPKIILAVCDPSTGSPQMSTLKLSAPEDDDSLLSPVPGPAPSHHNTNKHEPRSGGVQVAHWAAKAGIDTIKFEPTAQASPNGHARSSSDEDRPKRSLNKGPGRRGGPPQHKSDGDKLRGGLVERSPAVLTMMEMVKRADSKAVRVLARGEKLDP
ncbi:hypothetical protein Moror_10541 [Moniliophthora roreri MCA 2997]|uniref:PIN domain-containing protein n=1 Tax=Moniliophthora roreri (strain MCA 2997) TaxID=1381753 RepID=V2XH38_MONRO|nr:hypothetical protein Moror_10541 [Moniliophthora roreri MCA 2997]